MDFGIERPRNSAKRLVARLQHSVARVRVERQAVALHRSRASCRRGADRTRVLRAATCEILHASQLDSASAGSRHPPIQLPPLFCPRLRLRTRTRTRTCVRTRVFVFACASSCPQSLHTTTISGHQLEHLIFRRRAILVGRVEQRPFQVWVAQKAWQQG